ncbi:flavin-containing monooxygenase [Spirosoma oryzicola]|uniref:flavin-containing monooxygenase n=1 Tax=Spirosoma oryzicola TaxID=2898794 RepID=UPI001E60CF2C|nr:NAD(P)/FAD-dependent oxidoreductase [Spirosoma oryzicola]UHG93024.1 NAD(P)/FAD-dependent oxidoreductase [Spirosoma oryzicola]
MQARSAKTLIIGAGPAGLAIAGQLAHRQQPFVVIEASDYIGFSWRNHYDRLHLHTVKEHSALPHFPFPVNFPTYVPRLQFVDYLERYADHFNIRPLFNQQVSQISRTTDGRWNVQTTTDLFEAEQVVVATGYNRLPNKPELPGQRDFRGIIWHSCEYRNGAAFRDENVLVVGMGNTGAELALDLLDYEARPFISVRGPVSILPRDLFGRPSQKTAIFLKKFPNWFCDLVTRTAQTMSVGDVSGYGLGKPAHSPSYNARRGKPPILDVGTLAQIKAGRITVVPGIERVNAKTITFTDGRERPFDAIILATGYRPALSAFFNPVVTDRILTESGYPKAMWFNESALRGLYFLGFTTPVTGVLYNLNSDSNSIARQIVENNFIPA